MDCVAAAVHASGLVRISNPYLTWVLDFDLLYEGGGNILFWHGSNAGPSLYYLSIISSRGQINSLCACRVPVTCSLLHGIVS